MFSACTKQECDPQIYKLSVNASTVRERNTKKIEMIRDQNLGWVVGPNHFLGISSSEVAAYSLGEVPATREERRQSPQANKEWRSLLALAEQSRKDMIGFSLPVEVFTTDASNQGVCSACSVFAVTAILETCIQRVVPLPLFNLAPPRGLSVQHLLDCAAGSPGVAGCDGGRSFRYMDWLKGKVLDTARQYPYRDSDVRFEGLNNTYRQCYQSSSRPVAVVQETHSSWDHHTERDIENLVLEGHAVATTLEVPPDFVFYKSGVYNSPLCQKWDLGAGREAQWEQLRPLRHAVVIVGFGIQKGKRFWKVKNSWGENWGESGFFRIARDGSGHCGLGAFISVAVCTTCNIEGECKRQAGGATPPRSRPPTSLPEEGIILGVTTHLATPVGGLGALTCPKCQGSCPKTRPCVVHTRLGAR